MVICNRTLEPLHGLSEDGVKSYNEYVGNYRKRCFLTYWFKRVFGIIRV